MSLLLIGVSHRGASLELLERATLDATGLAALAAAALQAEVVQEVVVLATCNRLEVYAEVSAFHEGLAQVGRAFAEATGIPLPELADHLLVAHAEGVVAHLFSLACGLESMAVGEGQILGQLRLALRTAQDRRQAGRVLDNLLQQALRVGKRAHGETDLDRVSGSLIATGLARAERLLGPLADLRVLILGAGSMSALAAACTQRAGVAAITIANRTFAKAEHLAQAVGGRAVPLADLSAVLRDADIVIACTGAVGHVVSIPTAQAAAAERDRPQLYLDLALPRDIDPLIGQLAAIELIDLAALGADLSARVPAPELRQVAELVQAEVADYLANVRVQALAPTVAALRAQAAEVVQVELTRLGQRLPEADPATLQELQHTVHRVVEKILHAPTVKAKELASRGDAYAGVLRELFDLPTEPDELRLADLPAAPERQDLAALLAKPVTS